MAKKIKNWNDISGECRIFPRKMEGKKGDFMTFTTSIGLKDDDGEWNNMYVDVRFKKGEAPKCKENEAFTIRIDEGFLTFREINTKKIHEQRLVIVVMDYDEG